LVGTHLALDEIDCGFQGAFEGKEKIKFKREGDGILFDALCTSVEGALVTFRARKDTVESLRRDHATIYAAAPELATLHLRCLGLLNRPCVRGRWRSIWMDNLFTSLRFAFYASKLTRCHITGLCRPNRGAPNCVWQKTETSVKQAALAKGTLKKVTLLNGSFGVFIASVYDNKPVHVMVCAA
jgi:hypothetical protein